MIFRLLFILLAVISLACLAMAVRVRRRNIGFIMMTAIVALCDVICFLLLGCKSVVDARNVLTVYYICHAWFYFGSLWMVSALGRHKYFKLYSIPTLVICICQTVIIASNSFKGRILSFSRHLLLGKAWWVAEDAKVDSAFFNFPMYRMLTFINVIIILVIMILCCVHSARLFRARLYAFMVMHILFTGLEVVTAARSLPVWIICLAMNLICIIGLYLTAYYSNNKLRDWSLMSFANEMSDGFILYNHYDDPIHMNDLLKNTLTEELIQSFSDKTKLDEWISGTTVVDNIEVLKCPGDQGDIYFKVRKNEISENGESLGTIYILHDTTESILKMHAMEEANRELERAAKMKSDFLANMSHEIRTPMNAVIGMAEIALREDLEPHVADYLSQIQNSGRNLLNIINDILDFSKIEAGKMEIIPENYATLPEINDIANVLATRIGDKHLELFVIADTNIPRMLEGDIMRIRQVLINLANNAIKFTKEGMVLVKILCERTSEDQVMMTFHVIDTGQGIKKEDLDKLFVSFQQVDSKRNRSVEGTGLGLAISQRLCEAMGGSIGVKSEYGKGSDFYFNIPQKIIDPESDIVVEDAEHKHAFVINENPEMLGMFIDEMQKLGVDGHVIRSLSEYAPTGEKDYIFFELDGYNDEIRSFLDMNEDSIGIVLIDFDSTFESDRDNLRIMRRPETTLNMVTILNDQDMSERTAASAEAFKIDFIAPDAKILIVDDNAINITIAKGLLEPIKAQCFGAASGKEAIEMIRNGDFDIIMMDHMMPEMDGVETTRVIRKTIPEVADTPIIALTANAMEGVQEMFMEAGMNDFVAKPIDIRDLITKLKKWLPKDKMSDKGAAQSGVTDISDADGTVTDVETSKTGDEDAVKASAPDINYKGLNTEKALESLGSPELYQTVVKEYYRSGEDKYNEIHDAYEHEDWDDYTIKVHALKSSSRQIGADELGEKVEQLEIAGQNHDIETIRENTEDTLDVYKKLLDDLAEFFGEEEGNGDTSELPVIEHEELNRILDELYQACDVLDLDDMESCKEELEKYSYDDSISEMMTELFKAVDDIDVDICEELIERIRG